MSVLRDTDLPLGYGSVNPFVAVKGPGGAPAFVAFLVDVLDGRARAHGAEVVTDPTPFHGGQRLARVRDPWHNLWWLFEYGPDSTAPSEAPDELARWRPDPSAPPSYVKRTVSDALARLTGPR